MDALELQYGDTPANELIAEAKEVAKGDITPEQKALVDQIVAKEADLAAGKAGRVLAEVRRLHRDLFNSVFGGDFADEAELDLAA